MPHRGNRAPRRTASSPHLMLVLTAASPTAPSLWMPTAPVRLMASASTATATSAAGGGNGSPTIKAEDLDGVMVFNPGGQGDRLHPPARSAVRILTFGGPKNNRPTLWSACHSLAAHTLRRWGGLGTYRKSLLRGGRRHCAADGGLVGSRLAFFAPRPLRPFGALLLPCRRLLITLVDSSITMTIKRISHLGLARSAQCIRHRHLLKPIPPNQSPWWCRFARRWH